MPDAVVEKEISEDLLGSAMVSFGPKERELLELPEHSGDVSIRLDDDVFLATWNARSRHLSGEALADRLQEYAQVGWLLRFSCRGDDLHAAIIERAASTLRASKHAKRTPSEPAPSKPEKATRARPSTERYRLLGRDEYTWTGPVGIHQQGVEEFRDQITEGGWDPLEMLKLRLEGERLAALDQFEELLAVDVAKVDRMDHQEAAARKILTAMNGRGVLADEVGLGKTIEAGLVIKELRLRGLADRILVLCPATLREQWRAELAEKFDEEFDVALSGDDDRLTTSDRLIVSLNLGVRNSAKLNACAWDLVVVDEAHRLAGNGARKTRAAMEELTTRSRYVLFLTATPVQNNLLELYRLVELLRPGTFPTQRSFRKQFIDQNDPHRPVRTEELRQLVSQVMVRTTRAQAGLDRVKRHPTDHPVTLTTQEVELYQRCTTALRELMNEPADAYRRRLLAHRLTASPTSLAASALRMAAHHPNPDAAAALKKIGESANEIKRPAREQVALERIEKWVDEHGRVLVFTQHTDTAQGLLELLEAEGISAKSFHGRMGADARARSINAFRTGAASVLVSTDAGAEGQNLQFCNCVLNYDLPWNPMRIEQRIGRVHRVTQTRDVHVANLFAVGTIDEEVYRLLYDKLRMFELLFGQVTTILGELDQTDGDLTFEGRILDALVAPNERQMKARLVKLGRQLAGATAKANAQIGSDEGLSAWLAETQPRSHRANLTAEGATELRPEVTERRRERQGQLITFVQRYLKTMGAEIIYRADDRFLSARLPSELADEVGGSSTLHLAFDRTGMDEHPEAELCAVGSEVFEEIVRSLRRRGDLHATVVVPPLIAPNARIEHAADVELVTREIAEPTTWSAQTTWCATTGDGGHEEIVQIDVGPPRPKGRRKRRPLTASELLPPSLVNPRAITKKVLTSAASSVKLTELAEKASSERTARRHAEQTSRLEHLDDQLQELHDKLDRTASSDSKERLLTEIKGVERARAAYDAGTGTGVDVEIRAHPLTMVFSVGEEMLVRERWRHRSGVEKEISYPWANDDPPPEYESEAGGTVTVLALCQDGHLVDETQRFACESCTSTWCDACGPTKVMDACRVCAAEACAACRSDGLCPACRLPERRADLDLTHELAWQIGGHHTLFVAERSARIIDAGGSARIVVPDEDVDDDDRVRARAAAVALGLTADAGVRMVGEVPHDPWEGATVLALAESVSASLSTTSSAGSTLDPTALALLPHEAEIDVIAERGLGLHTVLAELRGSDPPPPAPAVEVSPYRDVTVIELIESGLRKTRWRQSPLAAPACLEVIDHPFERVGGASGLPLVLVGRVEVDGVEAELWSVHRSYLIEVRAADRSQRFFVPGFAGANLSDERAVAGHLAKIGLNTRTSVTFDLEPWVINDDDWARPAGAELERREVSDVWQLNPSDEQGSNRRPVTAEDLALVEVETHIEDAPGSESELEDKTGRQDQQGPDDPAEVTPLAADLAEGILRWTKNTLGDPPQGVVTLDHRLVTEVWRGDGRAERSYTITRDADAWPWLDDRAARASDFEVDTAGHLLTAGGGWDCDACETSKCQACGDQGALAECTGCDRLTCGSCRSAAPYEVKDLACGRCGFRSCSSCGRTPSLSRCLLCDRKVCRSCHTGELCATCANLQPATTSEIEALPSSLAANGLGVLIGHDQQAAVAVLTGTRRCEVATVTNNEVNRWITLEKEDSTKDLELRIQLARAVPTAGEILIEVLAPMAPAAPDKDMLRVGPPPRHILRWGPTDTETTRTWATIPCPALDADPLALLNSSLDSVNLPSQLPRRERQATRRLLTLDSPIGQERATHFGLQIVEDTEAIYLTSEGLLRQLRERKDRTELSPWTGAPVPNWAADGWDPLPTSCASASTGGVEAALVAHGQACTLGVKFDGAITWCRLSPDDDEILRLLLGAAIDQAGVVVDVTAVADPSFTPPTVRAAELVHRNTKPVVTSSHGEGNVDLLRQTAAAWGLEPSSPPMVELGIPEPLAMALTKRTGEAPAVPRMLVAIGLRVEEQWEGPDDQYNVAYELTPGAIAGLIVADDTGQAVSEVELDREGHLAAEPSTCSYCYGRTCRLCQDGVAWCEVCQIPVCRTCANQRQPQQRLCEACGDLKSTADWAHRRLDLDLPTKASVWSGKDDVHKVHCVLRDGHWTVTADAAGRARFPVHGGARQQQVLDDLLLGTVDSDPAHDEWDDPLAGDPPGGAGSQAAAATR